MNAAYYPKSLTNYKTNKARVAFIDKQLPALIALAEKLKDDISIPVAHYGDDAGAIKAKGIHGDPTAKRATSAPPDVAQLRNDIRALTIERHRRSIWIQEAETALSFLTEKERIIIICRLCDGMTNEETADEYLERTGDKITEKTVRYRVKSVLKRLEPWFSIQPPSTFYPDDAFIKGFWEEADKAMKEANTDPLPQFTPQFECKQV